MTIPPCLISKQVSFTFHGEPFLFHLSQSLFSSFEVDRGTRLLLEVLYPRLGERRCQSILDVGCGTGVLGIVLQRLVPSASVKGVDRDALALLFSAENARLNHLNQMAFAGALGTGPSGNAEWDLVVCNLPAKAGEPVLRHLMRSFGEACAGMVGIVIVKPLADMICDALVSDTMEIMEKREGRQHVVFLYRDGAAAKRVSGSEASENGDLDLAPYARCRDTYSHQSGSYNLASVFHLPEFDTIGYATRLAADLIPRLTPFEKAAIWSPGQGHLAVMLQQWRPMGSLTLGGRDLLALRTSRSNLIANGMEIGQIRLVHTAFPEGVEDTADLWVVILVPELEAGLCGNLLESLAPRVAAGGQLLIAGGSSSVYRVMRNRGAFRLGADRKRHGFRAVLLGR